MSERIGALASGPPRPSPAKPNLGGQRKTSGSAPHERANNQALNVYRIVWEPGSDRLHGICHCGAQRDADDPVELWLWLLAHPDHD